MKTFVVNLDREKEKLQTVAKRLAKVGVPFERFPAVYGKALSIEEKRAAKNPFRIWCAIGRPLQDGELGCALSHLGVYRRMLSDGLKSVCVLEDDVVFDERLPRQLERVENFLQTDIPRVVLLSDRTHFACTEWKILPSRHDFGTFAYAINLAAAKAILKANYPIQRPCDHWRKWVACGKIELYHAYPTACDYDHSVESGTADPHRVANYPVLKFIVHKVKRLLGRTFDIILPV